MQKIRLIILSVLLTMSCHALANIIPQAGLWSIVPESTGKPGRGLAIEVQGDTLILTVYGYTQDGRATFYLASGPYTNGQFNADLGMYEGGTVLGGERIPAQYLGSAGTVSLSFSSEAEGTVALPGEETKPIARLMTADVVKPYLVREEKGNRLAPEGRLFQIGDGDAENRIIQSYTFANGDLSLRGDQFNFIFDILKYQGDDFMPDIPKTQHWVKCELKGNYHQSGSVINSEGRYTCADNTLGTYRLKNLQRLVKNSYPSWLYQVSYSGQLYFKPQASEAEELYVFKGTEWNDDFDIGIATVPPRPEEDRVLNPQNGLWWTAVESQGIPGRGFSLDRQGDTLVLTFFGYDEKGHSTFYIASGPFSSYDGFSAELLMIEGGTALGGSHVPAQVTGSKGIVKLKFTSDVNGVITLPGEEPQAIRRFTADDASKRLMQEGGRFSGFDRFDGNLEYEFSLHNGLFELKLTARGKRTRTECLYAGTYEPVGTALYSSGDYECISKVLEKGYWLGNQEEQSKGTYEISDLAIDEWGVFSGSIRYSYFPLWFIDLEDDIVSKTYHTKELHIGSRYAE